MLQDERSIRGEGKTTNESAELKLFNFAEHAKSFDPSRERQFVSRSDRAGSFLSPNMRISSLDVQEMYLIVDSLNNYCGYLHGAAERAETVKVAQMYYDKLRLVEQLIEKLTG